MRATAALILASLATPVAGELRLALPVDCTLGEACFIQQYMDLDPSQGVIDYRCNALSYDGHKGTDFAVATNEAARAGVDVIASAPGRVLGTRDGMPDVWSGDIDADAIAGRDCGNGMVIDHGDGWHTQYCHLAEGSVSVAQGDLVETGDVLGQIGMSGRTQFPHVHLSVRKDGKPVDPFAPETAQCGEENQPSLWSNPIDYAIGGIVDGGFASAVPDYDAVKDGTAAERIMRVSPAIIAYSLMFGGRTGDVLRMTLTGPGDLLVTDDHVLPRNRARFFRAIGKKRRDAPWPGGDYLNITELIRDGAVISTRRDTFSIPR